MTILNKTRNLAPSLCLFWVLITLTLFEEVPAAVQLRRRAQDAPGEGYQRFHANDSYIGKPIPCTDDEKVCFGYNLLLDTDSDTCQPLGRGYVGGCILRVDKMQYEETSGRVYGVCQEFKDPCEGYRLAYDGRCYTPEVVRNVICGCEAEPTRHILGDVECRCTAATPTTVEQPKEAGRCKIPDFRFPDVERIRFKLSALRGLKLTNANCSADQKTCFGKQKVWVASAQGCYSLLKRGPCENDEVVVLTKESWTSGPAVCKHVRGGCPPGRVRMAFDGECHSEREMDIAAPGRLALNIVGEYDVLGYNEGIKYTPQLQSNACTFGLSAVNGPPPLRLYPLPTCTGTEPACSLFETYSVPPNPE